VPPRERPQLLDAFWRLAAERQNIYFRRLEGASAPWTEDPILETYKFCNAYRAADRVSQYLIKEVIYGGQGGYSADDQILRIVLFRLFSRPQTWELLCAAHGDVTLKTFSDGKYGDTLDRAFESDQRLYTSAFILCATAAYGHRRKHRNHLDLLREMLRPGGLTGAVAKAKSLGALVAALREYPLIGPFMAYQLAIDINYSELCDFDESEYTVAGPGAKRGVAKCFVDISDSTHEGVIAEMTARQDEEFASRGITFSSLFGRRLQAIDIQNLFCEVDKYARVAFPELRSNRSRIKARFRASGV
jgi:alpha-glutamyl/putrescinyl thymine pyrophosphorylase clade 1